MKSKVLHHIWHHVLPGLGLNAQRQQDVRALAYRLTLREDPQVRVLRQIRSVTRRSHPLLEGLPPAGGDPVIIWTMRGGPQVNATEALLAYALRLRGVATAIVVCDSFLPACEQRSVVMYPHGKVNAKTDAQICDRCHFNAMQVFDAFELPVIQLSTLVPPLDIVEIRKTAARLSVEEILKLEREGVALGGEIRAFMNQFYRALTWPEGAQTEILLRRAAEAALILYRAGDQVLEQFHPRAVLTSHGIYLLWGVMTRLAQRRGIPVTIWGHGYRSGTLRFSPGNWFEVTAAEPPGAWEGLALTPERSTRLDDYLQHRWDGRRDRRMLFDGAEKGGLVSLAAIGLNPAKPTLGVFPNVAWDADLNFKDIAFKNMFDWVVQTVQWFVDHPEYQLVVRAHPGEAISATSERVVDVVRRAVLRLPPNIALIPPESKVNTYQLAERLQAAGVYGSQVGLELLCRGIPVIVVSECFYRGKGIALEVASRQEYFALLARLPELGRLDEDLRLRARTYAYHYYFRRLIPFPFLTSARWSHLTGLSMRTLADLSPHREGALDAIVAGILENRHVLFDG